MRENSLKKALKEGKVVIGMGVSQLRGAAVPQLLAAAGVQFIWIDMQHSAYTIENVFELIIGTRAAGIDNIVRVPSIDPPLICQLLDSGVQGVMVPEIQTPEEVVQVVKAVKYPPEGERSLVGRRMHTDFQKAATVEMTQRSNEQTLIAIQIETKSAFNHLEEISQIPGVDVLWVGPNDLAQSLGHLGQPEHPEVLAAIEKMIEVSLKAKIAPAMAVPFDFRNADKWLKKGIKLTCYSNDVDLILGSASQGVRKIRELLMNLQINN